MTVVRVQTGHWGRTRGATGAYNPVLQLAEADMNHRLALELQLATATDRKIEWQFVGPDDKQGDPCHLFIALHMDGSGNSAAKGPSIGYPTGSTESKRFGSMWKNARAAIPGGNPFRVDNYTGALSGYYGFKSKYSGSAPVKLVIENGFVTNNEEATWAQMHRPDVAAAIVGTVRTYYGQPTTTPISDDDRLDTLEREVKRLGIRTAKQAKHIHGLQTRVTALEN